MKIYALYMFKKNGDKATLVDAARDFSDVGFMYRKHFVELSDFAAANLATSPSSDMFISAKEQRFILHMFHKEGSAAIVVATEDYPSRAAFQILRSIMTEYEQCGGNFPNGKSDVIQRGIREYQRPENADKLLKIQDNLQETQKIMTQNLEAAIGRGETLEELAEKSSEISEQAKIFMRHSQELNRCCMII